MEMKCRLIAIVTAANLVASAAFAEPPKAAASNSAPTQPALKQVVFASADSVQSTAPDHGQQAASTPKRPRAARVTTCRCGDPQPTVTDE
jgi:hypothetical protein